MATILPRETLLLIRVNEVTENIDAWRSSRLGKALAGMDIESVMAVNNAMPEDIERFTQIKSDITTAIDSAWFEALFSDTAAVAVLPPDVEQFDPDTPESFLNSIILISRPKHPAGLLESLSGMFSTQLNITKEEHGGHTLSRFDIEAGQSAWYAVRDGLLLLALHPAPVVACLSSSVAEDAVLSGHPDFRLLEEDMFRKPGTQGYVFWNSEQTFSKIKDVLTAADLDPLFSAVVDKKIANTYGVKAAGFAAYDDRSTILHKQFVFLVDKEKMLPATARAMSIAPEENRTLEMMPAAPLAYSWQNIYDLKTYWQMSNEAQTLSDEDLTELKDAFRQSVGMEIEEVMEAFGSQFGIVLNDITMGGMFPIPDLAIVAEVRKTDVTDRLVAGLIEKSGMEVNREDVEGTTLTYASIPFVMGLNPAYACKDGFCSLATTRDLVKTILSKPGSNGSLRENPDFKAVDNGLSRENNQIAYIRFAELVGKVQEIIRWGSSFMAMAQPDQAKQTQLIMDKVAIPVMDGLKMYQTIGLRSYITESQVRTDVWIEIDREQP